MREELIRRELARVLVKRAKAMAQLVLDDAPLEIPVEEARMREQLRQLEELEAQGVPNLGKGILALRDQIAMARLDRLADPWLSPDYQALFSDEESFLLTSNANLRPVLLRFIKRVEYHPGTGAIQVVLR